MKKIFIIICALVVGIANADNVITSKEYVDTQGATLQPEISAKNTNTVLTYPAAGTDTPGEKAIYDASAAYGAQTDALVTAGAFNSAMQNALESEFVCTEWQGSVHDNAHCLLYEVRSATQLQSLPAGYTQLEYIESTGTQWIDTGIILNEMASEVFVDFQKTNSTSDATLMGCQNNSGNSGIYNLRQTYYFRQHGELCLYNATRGSYNVIATQDLTRHTIYTTIDNNNNITINYDGTSKKYTQQPVEANSLSLFLFANNRDGVANQRISAKIYRVWINNASGAPVFNGVPARRDSDSKIGMYDTVSNTFFTNSGTGEFIAGPVASYLPQNQQ